jgi:hypothetical protein
MIITFKDETATGKILQELPIEVKAEILTVKDIIMARVQAEVESYNAKLPEYFNGLVQPTDAERVLNGYRLRERRQIDAEKQSYIALKAFQENGFFILIDNRQVDDLEEQILLRQNSEISFVKLTPLVGG